MANIERRQLQRKPSPKVVRIGRLLAATVSGVGGGGIGRVDMSANQRSRLSFTSRLPFVGTSSPLTPRPLSSASLRQLSCVAYCRPDLSTSLGPVWSIVTNILNTLVIFNGCYYADKKGRRIRVGQQQQLLLLIALLMSPMPQCAQSLRPRPQTFD